MKTSFPVRLLAAVAVVCVLLAPHLARAQSLREYVYMGGRAVAIENSSCAAITGTASFDNSSHSGTLTVTAPSGCTWTIVSNQSWLTITSGSGTGSGTVYFTLSANTTDGERIATLSGAGSFQITQDTALQFVGTVPCRVVDTRNPTGTFGGPQISAGGERDFPIPAGVCSIPSSAQAYAINVTVVPGGPLGYVTLWPTGQPQPGVSTLNSEDGRVKANYAIVPAGASGGVSVYANNATNVILDITGYFVPPSTNPSALAFYPLTPCRIADTRLATGSLGGPSMVGGATARSFPVLSSSCSIPSSAQAYSLNFTVVPPSGGDVAYITAFPTGQSQPLVSNLNDLTGTVVANAAIEGAGTSGAVSVFSTDNTDLLIDINGYFAPAGSGGLSLYNMAPCRALSTVSPFSGVLNVNVAGASCLAPATAGAYVLNATVVPTGGASFSFLTLWAYGASQPVVSTLNALDGFVTSNMAIVPQASGYISAYATNSAKLDLDISGYFAP